MSLQPNHRIPYKTVSNIPIPTDIYLPSSPPKNRTACPILIMIHGGAFMLGHAKMNNKDQIADCLERGWIVLAVEHRLCPGVNVLEGPITDVRDALAWAQNGGLEEALRGKGEEIKCDGERVMVMGTSSGGCLALCTAFNTPQPPLAILDFYGAKNFSSPFWTTPQPSMPPSFYEPLAPTTLPTLQTETTTYIGGSTSLEGQTQTTQETPIPGLTPNPSLRQSYAMHVLATGTVLSALWPPSSGPFSLIDPILNVTPHWPPTAIVHGTSDTLIPIHISRAFEEKLREHGVERVMIEVEGEEHTFCGKMEKGGRTWDVQMGGWEFLEGVLGRSYT